MVHRMRCLLVLIVSLTICSNQVLAQEATTPSSGLFSKLKDIAKAGLTGQVARPDFEVRAKEDLEAGIIRLTDETVDEALRSGERDTLWVILIQEDRPSPMSRTFLDAHTNASTLHQINVQSTEHTKILAAPHHEVKYARLDFTTEWRTCTRWMVFRPPSLVLSTNHSSSLRFLTPQNIRSDGERWTEFFASDRWNDIKPWQSEYAPGGQRAWLPETYISFFDFLTPLLNRFPIPSFVWLLISGAGARWVMSLMHSGGTTAASPAGVRAARVAAPGGATPAVGNTISEVPGTTPSASVAKKGGGDTMRAGKKAPSGL